MNNEEAMEKAFTIVAFMNLGEIEEACRTRKIRTNKGRFLMERELVKQLAKEYQEQVK
jgi:hypothetical protein